MRYRKRPVVVEAIEWNGENEDEIMAFCSSAANPVMRRDGGKWFQCFDIFTLEGWVNANPGDYIIRGTQGEFYPCKPDIFAEVYEKAE